jgi:predicted enzyme related to lactoylglutathione lyase
VTDTPAPDSDPDRVDARLTRNGAVSYLHIPALDPGRSARFYETTFGWAVRDHDSARPSFDDATGNLSGAWVTNRAVDFDSGPLPYVYVDRIDEAVERARAAGGEIVTAPYPEGNLLVAVVRDPAGNAVGLWQEVT